MGNYIIGLILIILGFTGIVFVIFIIFRAIMVYEERTKILNAIWKLNKKDIENGNEWKWRYKLFDKISFDKMLYEYWTPVKSFYKDSGCIK